MSEQTGPKPTKREYRYYKEDGIWGIERKNLRNEEWAWITYEDSKRAAKRYIKRCMKVDEDIPLKYFYV